VQAKSHVSNVAVTIWDTLVNRDVTNFQFKFDDVRTSNVFTTFEIRRMFKHFIVKFKLVEKSLFYN